MRYSLRELMERGMLEVERPGKSCGVPYGYALGSPAYRITVRKPFPFARKKPFLVVSMGGDTAVVKTDSEGNPIGKASVFMGWPCDPGMLEAAANAALGTLNKKGTRCELSRRDRFAMLAANRNALGLEGEEMSSIDAEYVPDGGEDLIGWQIARSVQKEEI